MNDALVQNMYLLDEQAMHIHSAKMQYKADSNARWIALHKGTALKCRRTRGARGRSTCCVCGRRGLTFRRGQSLRTWFVCIIVCGSGRKNGAGRTTTLDSRRRPTMVRVVAVDDKAISSKRSALKFVNAGSDCGEYSILLILSISSNHAKRKQESSNA
jgi:hypothetical protein